MNIIKKLVKSLVSLTALVVLIGGLSQYAKADEPKSYNWTYGSEYSATEGWCYEDGTVIENPKSLLSEDVSLDIVKDVEGAIESLRTPGQKIKVGAVTVHEAPKTNNFRLSDYFTTENLTICSNIDIKNKYIYDGNLNVLSVWSGYIRLNGNVKSTLTVGFNGNSFPGMNYKGSAEIYGDVWNIEIFKKTGTDDSITDFYTLKDQQKSIEASEESGYFDGDLFILGNIEQGRVCETYFSSLDNQRMTVRKADLSRMDVNGLLLHNGEITDYLKKFPEYKRYTTKEWYDAVMKDRKYEYLAYFEDNGRYNWYKYTYANGTMIAAEDVNDIDPITNLPKVSFKNARVFVGGTNDAGLIFSKDNIPSDIQIASGKVVIEGDIDSIYLSDRSKFYKGTKETSLKVNGNVKTLSMEVITKNTNISVSGSVNNGYICGKINDDHYLSTTTFNKANNENTDIIKAGRFNSNIVFTTDDGVKYKNLSSVSELEKAVGINESNNSIQEGDVLKIKQAYEGFEVDHLNEADKSAINSKIDTNEYEITNASVGIDVGTYLLSKDNIEKGENVSETNGTLEFSIKVPEFEQGQEYELLRVHENKDGSKSYDILDTKVNNEGFATFESDKFSSFVFLKKKSGNSSKPYINPQSEAMIRDFCSRMYTVALKREYDKNGLDDWTNRLMTHDINGAGIAYGFILSEEFTNKNLSNEEFVDTLYSTFFDRKPDENGRKGWLDDLANGKSRTYVLAGFVNSKEFDNLAAKFGIVRGYMYEDGRVAGAGIFQFVERMYTKALDRQAEKAGFDDWSMQIVFGQTKPIDVAKSFFFSQEFVSKNLSNSDYVEKLYQTFMDRASDPAGKADWVGKLDRGERTREEVLNGFAGSAEFANIMSGFGL